jgi:hypothetical protein
VRRCRGTPRFARSISAFRLRASRTWGERGCGHRSRGPASTSRCAAYRPIRSTLSWCCSSRSRAPRPRTCPCARPS